MSGPYGNRQLLSNNQRERERKWGKRGLLCQPYLFIYLYYSNFFLRKSGIKQRRRFVVRTFLQSSTLKFLVCACACIVCACVEKQKQTNPRGISLQEPQAVCCGVSLGRRWPFALGPPERTGVTFCFHSLQSSVWQGAWCVRGLWLGESFGCIVERVWIAFTPRPQNSLPNSHSDLLTGGSASSMRSHRGMYGYVGSLGSTAFLAVERGCTRGSVARVPIGRIALPLHSKH